MHRFHFVHTAGLRLDAPFQGVGRVPPNVRDVLADAAAGAWDDLVDACIARGVEFVIVAGGIEAGHEGSLGGRLRLRAGLRRLAEHGVRCFMSLREGDLRTEEMIPDSNGSRITVFPSDRPLAIAVERGAQLLATVCGQSAPAQAPVAYRDFFSGSPADAPRIGVVPGSLEDLERALAAGGPRASYWALGDRSEPSRRGFSPWIVESGTLQSRTPSPTEHGAHSAMLVEVEAGRVLAVDHMAVDRVRYEQLDLAPRFALDDALLCHQVLDELNRLRSTHSGRALLVDVVLTPAESGPAVTFSPDRAGALLERLREETESWDPFVWCSSLRMPTAPPAEPLGDDLAQAIVQESRALLGNSLQRSYYFARRFEPLMRRWTSELDNDGAERLIADATVLALQKAAEAAQAGD